MRRYAFLSKFRLVLGLASLLLTGEVGAAQGTDAPAMAMGASRMVQGTVTAVAADHVTVKTPQGEVYQVSVSANTRISKGRDPAKFGEIHVDDGVGAMGEIDPATKNVHALFLTVVAAEDLKKAREALGKTIILGAVTAINNLKLTIKRPDGVEQVIAVDEDTSFRRGGRVMQEITSAYAASGLGGRAGGGQRTGAAVSAQTDEGEMITLADVKVGSTVAGKGGLKNGIFVPTSLGVQDPGAARQRRPGAGAGGTIPPPSLEPR